MQANEFTIVHVNKFIPALQPCATPSDCTAAANSCGIGRCRVAVPYSFDSTPWASIPAVATDRFVFWITNPSMAMYTAFNDWCRGRSATLAFEIESSYSSIQIWRMDPYEFCPIDVKTGVRRCPEDASATYRTLPGFVSGNHGSEVCNQSFLVVAPTLTYVNEYNLAVTVLNTTFRNVDTATLRPVDASKARSVGADQPPVPEVDPDARRGEHLPLLAVHAVVREDVGVNLVEKMHGVRTARREGAQLQHAFLEATPVPLVRARDFEHRGPQSGELGLRKNAFQVTHLHGQRASDALDLLRAQRLAPALKFEGERGRHEGVPFLKLFFSHS